MTKTKIFAIIAIAGFLATGLQYSMAQEGGINSQEHKPIGAKAIPDWVRNNFEWYVNGQIDETTLLTSMNWMFDNNVMHLSDKAAKEVQDLRLENKRLNQEVMQYRQTDLDFARESAGQSAPFVPGGAVVSSAVSGLNSAQIMDQNGMMRGFILAPSDVDISALIQEVMRESYMETNKDLQFYADKVRHFNDQKEAIRQHISEMREARNAILDGTAQSSDMPMMRSGMSAQVSPSQTKVLVMGMVSDGHAFAKKKIVQLVNDGTTDPIAWERALSDTRMHAMQYSGYGKLTAYSKTTDSTVDDLQGIVVLCNTALDNQIQSLQAQVDVMKELSDYAKTDSTRTTGDPTEQVDGTWWGEKLGRIDKKIKSLQTAVSVCQDKSSQLETKMNQLEGELSSVGEDAQLANIDLQNKLQQQQQTLQTMSNVSKMLHDTAMAVIRKIG